MSNQTPQQDDEDEHFSYLSWFAFMAILVFFVGCIARWCYHEQLHRKNMHASSLRIEKYRRRALRIQRRKHAGDTSASDATSRSATDSDAPPLKRTRGTQPSAPHSQLPVLLGEDVFAEDVFLRRELENLMCK